MVKVYMSFWWVQKIPSKPMHLTWRAWRDCDDGPAVWRALVAQLYPVDTPHTLRLPHSVPIPGQLVWRGWGVGEGEFLTDDTSSIPQLYRSPREDGRNKKETRLGLNWVLDKSGPVTAPGKLDCETSIDVSTPDPRGDSPHIVWLRISEGDMFGCCILNRPSQQTNCIEQADKDYAV